jgi:hypothetical protein
MVGHPLNLAVSASAAIDALPLRGLSLAAVLVARLLVAAVGIGAGIALATRGPGAVALACWALGLSGLMDAFVYSTHFYPSSRMPGVTPIVLSLSLMYHASWLTYLYRSKRVRLTYAG